MTFQDQIKADLQAVVTAGELTTAAVYTPKKTGTPKNINGAKFPADTSDDEIETGRVKVQRCEFIITTDATSGIEAPEIDDMVTMDGIDWKVAGITSQGFGAASLALVAVETSVKQHESREKRIK